MARVEVRVSMFRDPIEVDEDEIPGLRSQGLLVEDDENTSDGSQATDTGSAGKRGPRTTTPAPTE